jgi:hypothetical protein
MLSVHSFLNAKPDNSEAVNVKVTTESNHDVLMKVHTKVEDAQEWEEKNYLSLAWI